MAHSIKIEDKLYEKLRAYCNINGISVTKLCNDAIADYLNVIKFGDAPFLIADKLISERQAAEEISEILTEKVLENSGMTVLESLEHNENGVVEINMKKLDGPDSIQTKFTVHNDGTVEMNEDEKEVKPKRPGKRRL